MVGRLLILSLCISLLGACASQQTTYVNSNSVGSSANNSYSPNKSYINVVTNFMQWKMHKLPYEDQIKQEQAVFFALNNTDEGQVIEWFSDDNNSSGKVAIQMTYPQGSGYCRVVFSQINYKSKTRNFKETACKNSAVEGWTFIR